VLDAFIVIDLDSGDIVAGIWGTSGEIAISVTTTAFRSDVLIRTFPFVRGSSGETFCSWGLPGGDHRREERLSEKSFNGI
jgi:hypothetical protein